MAMGSRTNAQAPAAFTPARHAQDEWMDALPGKHRIILDMTSPSALPEGIRFAGNLFTGHKTGYGLEEKEIAIIMVLRHSATAYGYTDAIWSKYGRSLGGSNADPAAPPPAANPYNTGDSMQLAGLAKRGVHFVVCGSASLGLARRIAGANGKPTRIKEWPQRAPSATSPSVWPAWCPSHAQERGYATCSSADPVPRVNHRPGRREARTVLGSRSPQEVPMSLSHRSDRRGFVARALAATAAGWSAVSLRASDGVEQAGNSTAWLKDVPGKSRCFFDFPSTQRLGLRRQNYLTGLPVVRWRWSGRSTAWSVLEHRAGIQRCHVNVRPRRF
jgi:hypothetical protein